MAIRQVHNAIVTRNIDDDLGTSLRGSVFFNAPTLMDGEYPLPAEPCFPFASEFGAGFFYVPKVGDEIEVEILADDGTFDTTDAELPEPRWRCMVYSEAADIDEEFKTNYPFRMGWVSNSGHIFLFDDFEGEEIVKLQHTFGNTLLFDEAGNWREKCIRDYFTEISGDHTHEVAKNQFIKVIKNRLVEVSKSETHTVKGNLTHDVGGDYTLAIGGKLNLQLNEYVPEFGFCDEKVQGSKVVNIAGGAKEIVGGSKSASIVGNQGITIAGDDSKLVAGGGEETYGTGFKKTIALGNDEVTLIAGNHVINITAGNIEIKTLAGGVEMGNAIAKMAIDIAGAIEVANAVGSMTMDVAGAVEMTNGNGKMSMDIAGNVELGNASGGKIMMDPAGIVTAMGTQIVLGTQQGNVLTNLTDPVVDTITGAPHIGVPTVFAG